MKSNNTKLWVATIVIGIIAIVGLFIALNRSSSAPTPIVGSGGEIHTVTEQFAGGMTIGKLKQVVWDAFGKLSTSPDGFTARGSFTTGTTTSVVRGVYTNAGSPLLCDGDSLVVYTDAQTAFAPSFKFAVGTSTTAGYSANLIASTTVATTTDTVTSIASGWSFLLPTGSSITVSVGDYSAAIASSTYYGGWANQFAVHCWTAIVQ